MIEFYNNEVLCVVGGSLIDEGIISSFQYNNFLNRKKIHRLQRGGNGRPALIEYKSLPTQYKNAVIRVLGYDPEAKPKHSHFRKYLTVDREAVTFFSNYLTREGNPLPFERQKEYHANAMFLNALHNCFNNIKGKQGNMGNSRRAVAWNNLTSVADELREEYEHTLPANPVRLKDKLKQYLNEGYTSLIHRGYGNNNPRIVDQKLEQLILSIYVMNNKPYPNMVRDIYLEFLAGKVDILICDEKGIPTGEFYDRKDFFNQRGEPKTISEATTWNYINKPKNRPIVDGIRNDHTYFQSKHEAHHFRHSPNYSLSKISLDDRDLVGKVMVGGKAVRVKAYYAYDVASGCLIGTAYSYNKDKDLFIACMREMFRFLKRNNLGFPLEPEVEHHIVKHFENDLMKAGNIFKEIRWCAAGNSQEKRAENFNKAKKYGYEKRYNDGIGRFYLTEANRPKQVNKWDENGMYIKETIFTYDEMVANDLFTIDKYNNSLHPNQKKYTGMTRMQVLLSIVNPNCVTFQDHIVAKYAGESTQTSIRRNQYCQVQYEFYSLPNPEMIARLGVHDYKVDAWYMPEPGGMINKVHLFQNERFLCTCEKINRYNEATVEQTDEDRAYMLEQNKYVAQQRAMFRKGRQEKTTKVKIVSNEPEPLAVEVHPTSVYTPVAEMEDESVYDFSNYGERGKKNL